MKKNLMSILILALVLANLVFTALLTFSILPATRNANKLIEEVAEAIHLELNAGKTTGQSNVSMENLETYNLSEGETITINLKKGSDGEDHFAVVSVYLSLNKEHEDYDKYGATMDSKASIIKNAVISSISAHTKEEMNDQSVQDEVVEEILESLQMLYDSDFIVSVGFTSLLLQ